MSTLYAEAFFKENTNLLRACASKVDHLKNACKNGNVEDVQKVMMYAFVSLDTAIQMSRCHKQSTSLSHLSVYTDGISNAHVHHSCTD